MKGGPGRARVLVGAVAAALVVTFYAAGPVRAANPYSPTMSWSEPAEAPTAGIGDMAFDPSTGQTIYFGGQSGGDLLDQTWSWDGSEWNLLSPVHSPPPRAGAELAFDANTGDLLLFGGQGEGFGTLTDTWTWDGTDWTQRFPAESPPSSRFDTMSFDAANGEMVLLIQPGGGQTWTWDGTNWTREFPANSPSARLFSASAFDPARGNVVLFGGFDFTDDLGDTWIWNGSNWIQQSPAHSPSARERMSMAFNPLTGNVMLHGGMSIETINPTDTWEWDGSDWTQVSPQSPSIGWVDNAMAYDSARGNMVYAGRDFTQTYGPPPGLRSKWFEQSPATSPPGTNSAGSTFDQSTGTTVLFGGQTGSGFTNETWNWNGTTWAKASPATSPSARYYPDPAFDPSEGNTILFAGNDLSQPNTLRNDTWSWSGSNWTELAPVTRPSLRSQSALAFDPSMGKLLLFGGTNAQVNLNETWTWDGTNWTQLNPPNSPSGRSGAGMAFDESAGNMVMFGGANQNDTWTWDGSTWTQVFPSTSPSPRDHPRMDFDPTTGDIVLFGGYADDGTRLVDTWLWDGANWTERTGPNDPGPRSFPTMNFDPNSGGMVLFGGYDGTNFLDETWTYELIADPPNAEIASPADGATFAIDEPAPTSFTCEAGAGGPAVDTCLDSNGDPSPGELDTSTAGTHAYTVTATAESGQTGDAEVTYEVVKTEPSLSITGASSGVFGTAQLYAQAALTDGDDPTGTIEFRGYGPADPDCSDDPKIRHSGEPVDGNGTYAIPAQDPQTPGSIAWVASYSGDAKNDPVETVCGAPGSVSVIEKAAPDLTPSEATSNLVGQPVTFSVALGGAVNRSGTITYRAYGPDDPTCSESPHFTSDPVLIPQTEDRRGIVYTSPDMVTQALGEFRWVAEYSGNYANEPASTVCGAPNSISTISRPEPPICPAGKLDFRMSTFKPNRRARNSLVPGIRIRVKSRVDVDAVIRPRYRYEMNGGIYHAGLKTRMIRINGQRRLLFGVPKQMAEHLRRATGQVSRNRVTFIMWAVLRRHGTPTGCDQKAKNKILNTRISGVSGKRALRRLISP